jgi:cardiolipin synthase
MRLRWVTAAALLFLLWGVGAGCLSPTSKRTRYSYQPDYGAEDPQFLRSLQALRTGIKGGNQATLLENGDALWADMFAALRAARQSINIETYIFDDGRLSQELVDILCERAQAGVEVRVLVDAWGARAPLLESRLKAAGVRYRHYKPIRLYALYHIEDRTHRKLVIVDGRIGYCGGFCFDDRWLGNARNPNEWRELTVRVEGPVVAQMQSIFLEDWLHTTGEVLHGDRHFPPLLPTGEQLAQAISSAAASGLPMPTSCPMPKSAPPSKKPPAAGWTCASSPPAPTPTLPCSATPPVSTSPTSSKAALKSTNTSPPCSTAKPWWWTAFGPPSAASTSMRAPSRRTPRPT